MFVLGYVLRITAGRGGLQQDGCEFNHSRWAPSKLRQAPARMRPVKIQTYEKHHRVHDYATRRTRYRISRPFTQELGDFGRFGETEVAKAARELALVFA